MEQPVVQTDEAWDRVLDRIERLVPLGGARSALSSSRPGVAGPALAALVDMLAAAHRGERQRGIGGHWTFDANRLIGLEQALAAAIARRRIMLGRLGRMRESGPVTGRKATEPSAPSPCNRGG